MRVDDYCFFFQYKEKDSYWLEYNKAKDIEIKLLKTKLEAAEIMAQVGLFCMSGDSIISNRCIEISFGKGRIDKVICRGHGQDRWCAGE